MSVSMKLSGNMRLVIGHTSFSVSVLPLSNSATMDKSLHAPKFKLLHHGAEMPLGSFEEKANPVTS